MSEDFITIRDRIWDSALSANTKFVLFAVLKHWSRKNERPFPSVPTMARMTGLSDRTVRRAVADLERQKVVSVARKMGRSNSYTFHWNHLPGPGHTDTPVTQSGVSHSQAPPAMQSGPPGHTDTPPLSGWPPKKPREEINEEIKGRDQKKRALKLRQDTPPNPSTQPLLQHYLATFRLHFGQDHHPISKGQMSKATRAMKEIAETDGLDAGKKLIEKALSLKWEGYHTPWGIAAKRTDILAAVAPRKAQASGEFDLFERARLLREAERQGVAQ